MSQDILLSWLFSCPKKTRFRNCPVLVFCPCRICPVFILRTIAVQSKPKSVQFQYERIFICKPKSPRFQKWPILGRFHFRIDKIPLILKKLPRMSRKLVKTRIKQISFIALMKLRQFHVRAY